MTRSVKRTGAEKRPARWCSSVQVSAVRHQGGHNAVYVALCHFWRRHSLQDVCSWGVAFRPPTTAARAPEAARGLRRRRDAFQGWPVPSTIRAAAAGLPYHQVWPPPATFHLPPASRRRRRRPPAAAPSSARCGPPATRFAARTASHAHDASSCPSASLSGGVGRRTGHARDPLAGVRTNPR